MKKSVISKYLENLMEGKGAVDQYLAMLTEKQKEKEGVDVETAKNIIDESEVENEKVNVLLERIENIIGDRDKIFEEIEDPEDDDVLSGDTISDEDLLIDEE